MKTTIKPFLELAVMLILFFNGSYSMAQFNDTIFYKSGKILVVEIDTFKLSRVEFSYVNPRGKIMHVGENIGSVDYFKIYDANDSLTLDSNKEFYKGVPGKDQDNLEISRHSFTLSPIRTMLLSPKIRYNYTFGENMELAINVRGNYNHSRFFNTDNFNYMSFGVGLKFTPFYNKRYSIGFDFTPSIVVRKQFIWNWQTPINGQPITFDQPTDFELILGAYMPGSIAFDLFINKHFALTADFGAGPVFFRNTFDLKARGMLGITWRFKQTKTISQPLLYHLRPDKG